MTTATAETALKLTEGQTAALEAFETFLLSPLETVFVLSGYSGCGKSTLVKTIVDRIPGIIKMLKLIDPNADNYKVALTATTNKAAENLSQISGSAAGTIQSFLGLRVTTDWKTNVSKLVPKKGAKVQENYILFIDEYSKVDKDLLHYIFQFTRNCKIIFVGDPAQLVPFNAKGSPVEDAKFTGAKLTEVVRQADGNPIIDLGTKFRNTVNTGEFFNFTPDGHHIRHLPRDAFNQAVLDEFTRTDWRFSDSKVLGWTNKCVIGFNHFIRNHGSGNPKFAVGDYAVCNSFLSVNGINIKTDQMVQITQISEDHEVCGVLGNSFTLDHRISAFMPKSIEAKNTALKNFRHENKLSVVAMIEQQWVDLRSAYACTVDKAQGSTYDKVFIDLDDISRCNSGDQIARMLYVAVTRARDQVFFTGDLA